MNTNRFTLTIELFSAEESEAGDTDRRGWTYDGQSIEAEPWPMQLREAFEKLHFVESRKYSGRGLTWSGHAQNTGEAYNDWQSGDEVAVSLHAPEGTTESSLARIERALIKRNLCRGN